MAVQILLGESNEVPVDFLADPDGRWDYEGLVQAAGFAERSGRVAIGALTEPFQGFPEGAAVVEWAFAGHCARALVNCSA